MLKLFSWPLRLTLAGAGLAVSFLPRSAEMFWGPKLGRLVLACGGFKLKTVRENLSRCFPDWTPTERERLIRLNFEHYGILFFEFLHFSSPLPGHYRAYAGRISVLEGSEHWKKANARGKGVIFVSSHLGFWEMSAAAAGLAGMAPTVVTTYLKPKWLHDKIVAARQSAGVLHAFHPGSVPAVMKALRRGGCAAFMNDQYSRPPMGLPVPFFGVKVDTLAAVAPLALRSGAAVVPVTVHRDAAGLCHVVIEPEIEFGDALRDATKATTIIAAIVERWVRARPEQWLWIHRRFKNVQEGQSLTSPNCEVADVKD